jgi:mono/diheme cytochrome c family protein
VRPLIFLALLIVLVACGPRPAPADPVALGAQVFRGQCLGCHGVEPGAPTALGPNLAGVASRAAANPDGLSAADWLRRATVNPGAEIAPGYKPGLMPASYGQTLSPEELDALVAYMLSLE